MSNEAVAQTDVEFTPVLYGVLMRLAAQLPTIPFDPSWMDANGRWLSSSTAKNKLAAALTAHADETQAIFKTMDLQKRLVFVFNYNGQPNVIYQRSAVDMVNPTFDTVVKLDAVCASQDVLEHLLEGRNEELGLEQLGAVFTYLGPSEAEKIVLEVLEEGRADKELQELSPEVAAAVNRLRRAALSFSMHEHQAQVYRTMADPLDAAGVTSMKLEEPTEDSRQDHQHQRSLDIGFWIGIPVGVIVGLGIKRLLRL